jgi:hypothetical protein
MVLKLVEVIDPIVRTTDGILGECISMRVCIVHLFKKIKEISCHRENVAAHKS